MSSHSRDADGQRELTRRSVLGGVAAAAGAAITGAGTLVASSRPAAAIDGDPAAFEAGDAPTVTSNDGRIESVYLSPTLNVSWTDFSERVERVTLTLAVGSDAGVDKVYRETLTAADPGRRPAMSRRSAAPMAHSLKRRPISTRSTAASPCGSSALTQLPGATR